ncbi:hypothetical protein NE645_18975, partial [Roseburia hominis]|nr:hypothetical protein [Roseburia hominis]
GLHVYFFLATACKSKPKDFGTFITAAEWLDVNYGSLVRKLMLAKLGGSSSCIWKRLSFRVDDGYAFPAKF